MYIPVVLVDTLGTPDTAEALLATSLAKLLVVGGRERARIMSKCVLIKLTEERRFFLIE